MIFCCSVSVGHRTGPKNVLVNYIGTRCSAFELIITKLLPNGGNVEKEIKFFHAALDISSSHKLVPVVVLVVGHIFIELNKMTMT